MGKKVFENSLKKESLSLEYERLFNNNEKINNLQSMKIVIE